MKRTYRLLALVLAMFMVVTMFAGCGKTAPAKESSKAAEPNASKADEAKAEPSKAEEKKIKIGISLPTQREERWVWDKENFERLGAELGVELAIQIADNDATKQQSQCENLLAQGIDVLIIAPHDGKAAGNIIDKAHEAGVKVISYDRLAENCDVDLYVTFDSVKVGEMQGEWLMNKVPSGNIVVLAGDPGDSCAVLYNQGAMNKIQPKIDSGEIKLVYDQKVKDWQPSEALKHMENALTANNNNIQGVLAPNDGTAGAVIQALAAQGLAGKVPVTGLDGEVAAAKRILEGTQGMTVFGDIRDLGEAAMIAAIKIANKKDPDANQKYNNGKIDVPSVAIGSVLVEKDNLNEVLIESGFIREDEIK
ncbi:substrate-binding domain-containing protein [Oscillospiraceae bacterium PP1C4]